MGQYLPRRPPNYGLTSSGRVLPINSWCEVLGMQIELLNCQLLFANMASRYLFLL